MNNTQSATTLLCGIALSCAFAASAAPFITVDFSNEDEGVVESAQRNLSLRLDGDTKILPDGPTGKPFAYFPGTPDCGARVSSRAKSSLPGSETAVSFWFRPDALADTPIAFGFSMKSNWRWSEAPLNFSLATAKNDFGTYNIATQFQGNPPTNGWHHLAFVYSISNNHFAVWFDGVPQKDAKIEADEPSPIANLLNAPFAKGYKGAIADIKIWNTAPAASEILEMDVSEKAKAQMAGDFDKAAADASLTKSFRDWSKAVADSIRQFNGKCNVREWMRYAKLHEELPQTSSFAADIASGKNADGLAGASFIPLSIYPFHWLKRLPFRIPEDGAANGSVDIKAAIGEYEAASFMVYPLASSKAFHITATDLAADGGASLKSDAVDIRTAKVWHSHASGWNSYFGGGKHFPVLTPEILLHDDALVKVDKDAHKNYLRLSYDTGARYVDISQSGTPENMERLLTDVEPIRDTADFQPMPVSEGELSQFWITVKVPDDAKPGLYTGKLNFTADGKPAGSMPLTVKVHPFKLPLPATRYNIDQRFTGTWYNHINLNVKMGPVATYGQGAAGSLSNACHRLRGELRNMVEHGQLDHFGIAYANPAEYDLCDLELDIYSQVGIVTNVIHTDYGACDGLWCAGMNREPEKYNYDLSVEANEELFRKCMSDYSNNIQRVQQKVREKFGHGNIYCYGIDEAGQGTVRREMPFFATLQHFGGKAMISMAPAEWCGFMADFDNIPAHIGRTVARNWHEAGCLVGTYAAPFTGPENPELWRRSMGIRLYMANYDAVANYNWYEACNVWNNFINAGRYGNFCIVYPTADGVVDTVGWEAQREAFDDIRYLTLLRRLARQAMRSGKRDLIRLGRRCYAWAELVDPEAVDLDQMRVDAAEKIIELQNALAGTDISALYK